MAKRTDLTDHVLSTLNRYGIPPERAEKKLWGVAVPLSDPNRHTQSSLAVLDAGGYSSIHIHNQKVNVFCCERGEMVISIWDRPEGAEIVDPDREVKLLAGESLIVDINIAHQMHAVENSVCVEFYYCHAAGHIVSPADIQRLTTGGQS